MNVIRKGRFISNTRVKGLTRGKVYKIIDAYGGEYIGVIDDFGNKITVTDFWFD